ncbi:MAG: hypothetical protein WCT52_02600 [Candidatus Micrarchaeia archaeon]
MVFVNRFVIFSMIAAAILLSGCALFPSAPPAGNTTAPEQNTTQPVQNQTPPEPVLVGNDSDEHGCKGSAGYVWCNVTEKCIRPWEENCTAPVDPLFEQAKTYCSKEYKVYICGENVRVTGSVAGGVSTIYSGGIAFVCPPGEPESMSPKCRELLFASNCVEKEVC